MEKMNNHLAERRSSGIREELLKKMKGRYNPPEVFLFSLKEKILGECSDMASLAMGGCGGRMPCATRYVYVAIESGMPED